MTTPQPLTQLLQQFRARYQNALLTKASVRLVLLLGSLGLLAWRLYLRPVTWGWAIGVPLVLGVVAITWLGWWLRRRWISPRNTPAHLDQALHLDQRLITAAEFANVKEPPALYPLLLEDVSQRSTTPAHIPRLLDRTTGTLALFLLILLLWPSGSPLQQLAKIPQEPLHTPEPPPQQPPPPSEPQQSDQQQQAQQQPQQERGGGASQPSSSQGQQNEPRQQHHSSSDQQQQGRQSQQRRNNSGGSSQESRAQQQGDRGQESAQAGTQQQGGSSRRDGSAQSETASRGGSTAGGNEAELKAEIQELLKEVSGELQQLQAQIASANDQGPEAGTNTDPSLYESPSALEPSVGAPLPIGLTTDSKETKKPRQGSGVGKPSGEVGKEAPQAKPQDVSLSDRAREETPSSRQSIPQEYQGVFDALQQPEANP